MSQRAASPRSTELRHRMMPAEWERHEATWIAWPHHEPDWPGKLGAIPWVYAEIVRVLHAHERVEILCHDESVRDSARSVLDAHSVAAGGYRLHLAPNDRVWLRDSAPTFVLNDNGKVELINWRFNGLAKYDNHSLDERIGEAVASISGLPRVVARRADLGEWLRLQPCLRTATGWRNRDRWPRDIAGNGGVVARRCSDTQSRDDTVRL